MKTKRHTHPCNPEYHLDKWIGKGTALENPTGSVDPKMLKYLAKHNTEEKRRTSVRKSDATPAAAEKKVEFASSPSTEAAVQQAEAAVSQAAAAEAAASRSSVSSLPLSAAVASAQAAAVPRTITPVRSRPDSATCAADAANQKAYELRQRAIAIDNMVKKESAIKKMVAKNEAPQLRYSSTSFRYASLSLCSALCMFILVVPFLREAVSFYFF